MAVKRVVVVFRSHQNLLPRKDDHTYLASTPVTVNQELSQPLPFRQTAMRDHTAKCKFCLLVVAVGKNVNSPIQL